MALFMDLVALSNGLHGSVQMDSVALFSWIGWLRHHGIFNKLILKINTYCKIKKSVIKCYKDIRLYVYEEEYNGQT